MRILYLIMAVCMLSLRVSGQPAAEPGPGISEEEQSRRQQDPYDVYFPTPDPELATEELAKERFLPPPNPA